MMEKILTVIIPTYNMEKYLDKCLTSLIIDDKELMRQLEVLVINDGSKDRSSEIAHNYESKYPDTFRVIDKENGNYGSCINRGLKEATGKYVKVLDADDSYDTKGFAQYLDELETIDADLVVTDYVTVNTEDNITKSITYTFPQNRYFTIGQLNKKIQMHAITYRTNNLHKIGYHQTEGISYTDQEWIFWPFIAVEKIIYLPVSVYRYLLGREGQTCDLSVYYKSVKQLMRITESCLSVYNTVKSTVTSDTKVYLRDLLYDHLTMMYSFFIIHGINNIYEDLLRLDDDLAMTDRDLYELTGKATSGRRSHVRYISVWRKSGRRHTPPHSFASLPDITQLLCPSEDGCCEVIESDCGNPRVACVIVTYNRKEQLIQCLDAVQAQTQKPVRVYITDNASTDGTVECVKQWGGYNCVKNGIAYKYLLNERNEGGAGGFYLGMKTAYEDGGYDGIWVMDDDGMPDIYCLERLCAFIDEYDYIAPTVLSIEDHTKLAFPSNEICNVSELINMCGTKGYVKDYACPFNGILYTRKLINTIGFPIKDLFIWGDEINYDLRAKEAGFIPITVLNSIHYHPKCKVSLKKTLLGHSIVFVPQKWKGYCHYRNFIYNYKHRISLLKLLWYYLKHAYYFIFILRDFSWLTCFTDAYFSGLCNRLNGHLKYMKK